MFFSVRYFVWTMRQSGQLVFSRTSEAFKGFTGGEEKKDTDAKSRSSWFRHICPWLVQIVPLTHGKSAVFQGHVVCNGEALAQTFSKGNESKNVKMHGRPNIL